MPHCGISVQLQARSPAAAHAGAGQGGEGPTAQGQGACTEWEKGWELATATGHAEPAQPAALLTPVSGHPSSRYPSSEDTDQQR